MEIRRISAAKVTIIAENAIRNAVAAHAAGKIDLFALRKAIATWEMDIERANLRPISVRSFADIDTARCQAAMTAGRSDVHDEDAGGESFGVTTTKQPVSTGPARITHDLTGRQIEAVANGLRVADQLMSLFAAEHITAAHVAAGMRWRKDWLAYEAGYSDTAGNGGEGDAHTGQLARSQAGARIQAVRAALGLCGEIRLRMLLVEDLSMTAIGEVAYPASPRKKAGYMALATCQIVLEQLAEHYHTADCARKA